MNFLLINLRTNSRIPNSLLVSYVRGCELIPQTRERAFSCCRKCKPFTRNFLVCSNVPGSSSQLSVIKRQLSNKSRRTTFKIPDELWVLLIVGMGGVAVFTFTYQKKKEIKVKRGSDLQMKLAKAKQYLQNEEKEDAYVLLKEVLNMIHNDIAEKQRHDPSKKGKRPFHKALKYVLDQSANLAIELEKWDEAEYYLRLTLQEMLATGTSKEDDAVIEISLKLSQACENQNKNDLALVGYQWCVDTAENNIDQADEADDNSKALLGLCLDGLGMFYLSHGEPEKAAETLEKALEVAEEVLGQEDDQVLVIMSNLAKAYAESQRYEEAETLAMKSIKLADQTESSFKAFVLANLGLIYLEGGKVKRAKKAMIKAFRMADESDDDVVKDMIKDSTMKLDINV
ncbi:tetratricopeptide repeat protein 19, mitochondrial-like [Actinia tenebrosa]|uniref:Tetratricopeptide repeat protein 19, mitochondrial-like n=1 Tax=Actinia tenebrosa TaxID=6105 RepID=A0A6P8IPA7_ACTTE|nr:tetratricopeptide repeat protein 19, mitochondrial-like [Actinia tenebrosa]